MGHMIDVLLDAVISMGGHRLVKVVGDDALDAKHDVREGHPELLRALRCRTGEAESATSQNVA
jgi:hypothetical protein